MDLTNAYLHASIQDKVYIYISDGFPGKGEIALLVKAAYGTKQGARRFYDHVAQIFEDIGLKQCPNEPCLHRYIDETGECFVLTYVDDALITGTKATVEKIQAKLKLHFKCKFNEPKDFLGLDVTIAATGNVSLSMSSFTTKMTEQLQIPRWKGEIGTPGRTDMKILKDAEDKTKDESYRSKVGSLNWLTMGLRYDLVYATKELSRVLTEPTTTALQLLDRALQYTLIQTKDAYLEYDYVKMSKFKPPETRKKPTDKTDIYDTSEYNIQDEIPNNDDVELHQEYLYKGEQITLTCETDIDLGGQKETRQSTSGYMLYLN